MRSLFIPTLFSNAAWAIATYDYIIVGGGTTGLVVANRLTENSSKTVLVIENGALDNGTKSSIPGNYGAANMAAMYDMHSAPVPNLGNKSFSVSVGNVVGGGSYVNGMLWDRGSNADYDVWAELGNKGWGWSDLWPYFMKSSSLEAPSDESVEKFGITYDEGAYGDGPLKISISDYQFPDMKIIYHSWDVVDIPHPKEGFDEPVGVYWAPNSINKKTGARSTSRSAYYDPIVRRPNLRLLTNTHVDEITFKNNSLGTLVATGVRYTSRSTKNQTHVLAAKEVILAAGSVFTPHLLMLSGIGPKDVLAAAGISVKKDLAAVGSNLQDHVPSFMNFGLQHLDPQNLGAFFSSNVTFNQTSYNQYLKDRSGPYAAGKTYGLVFLALQHFTSTVKEVVDKIRSQVVVNFLPARYARDEKLLAGYQKQREILMRQYSESEAAVGEIVIQPWGLTCIAHHKPLSRGTITLNKTHPAAYPIVQWNTFQNPVDAEVIVALTRYTRKHWARPELAVYKPVETAPGPQCQTDEEIIQCSIKEGTLQATSAHQSGSCSMMPEDLGGCVSDGLLVYGVKKLSVVDASIMPMIPAAHLQATLYAVAEKAADLIKERA